MSSGGHRLFFDFPYCIMRKNPIYWGKDYCKEAMCMYMDNAAAAQRLAAWVEILSQFDLPDWERLPQLDLYMDQVIILLKRYLSPVGGDEDEKSITASIINNYVRMKVMPPPVKKKYSRVHIAYLIIICTLKQSLSISCIQKMLPAGHGEEAVRALYTEFVARFRSAVAFMRQLSFEDGRLVPESFQLTLPQDCGVLVITSAIFAALAKSLTGFLLYEEPEEPQRTKDEKKEKAK